MKKLVLFQHLSKKCVITKYKMRCCEIQYIEIMTEMHIQGGKNKVYKSCPTHCSSGQQMHVLSTFWVV